MPPSSRRAVDSGVLSVRQDRILEVIGDYWAECGIAPTVREVAYYAGCSVSNAAYQIGELVAAGRLTRRPRIPRSVRVAGLPERTEQDGATS